MKIVIDIDEDYYEIIKHDVNVSHNDFKPLKIIANGTPLPKGHGDLISRQAVKDLIRGLTKWGVRSQDRKFENVGLLYDDVMFGIDKLPSAEKTAECKDMGEVSDGYHTFNQLYHQRAILFATIVNQNKDISWKSFKHEDGKYCFDKNGDWFIVGIDTPLGSYTYHYEKKYWDYFKCKELEIAKHWDGHTEEDVIRLLSLGDKNDL